MRLKQPPGRPRKYTDEQRDDAIQIAKSTVRINAREIGERVGVPAWKVLEWLTAYDNAEVRQ